MSRGGRREDRRKKRGGKRPPRPKNKLRPTVERNAPAKGTGARDISAGDVVGPARVQGVGRQTKSKWPLGHIC